MKQIVLIASLFFMFKFRSCVDEIETQSTTKYFCNILVCQYITYIATHTTHRTN